MGLDDAGVVAGDPSEPIIAGSWDSWDASVSTSDWCSIKARDSYTGPNWPLSSTADLTGKKAIRHCPRQLPTYEIVM